MFLCFVSFFLGYSYDFFGIEFDLSSECFFGIIYLQLFDNVSVYDMFQIMSNLTKNTRHFGTLS